MHSRLGHSPGLVVAVASIATGIVAAEAAAASLERAADVIEGVYGYGYAPELKDLALPPGRLSAVERAALKEEQQRQRQLQRALQPLTTGDCERIRLAAVRRAARALRRGAAL